VILYHPSHEILDSSKLDDYLTCPRRFFYCHVLGWRLDQPAHDLYFGECWHCAREYQLINGYEDLEGAYHAFITRYREQFDEESDSLYRPKTPEAVQQALANFAVTYYQDLEENQLLHNPETNEPFTEISGTVPIDEKRVLHFRMDSLLQNKEGKIFSWDHKTTTARWIVQRTWEMGFFLSIQNGTYTHCMYCLFPVDQVLGVEFCGVGFEYLSRGSAARPAGYYSTLRRVPAYKTPDQMNVWLWTVLNLINDIDRDMDRLSECKEADAVMEAFPLNPGGCTKFRGCEFHDYCMAWPNPLRQCQEPPLGFKQSFWDPREKDSRNKMKLEWR
jgi:hypothetical protein